MPFITVKVSSAPSAALSRRIADGVSALTAKLLGKKPEVTAVTVEYLDPADWFVGGASLAGQRKASFWLDVKVTAGTNVKDEKAAYLEAVFAFMGEVLEAPLHEESYVLVHEVPADSYGYGGRTQEWRYVAARIGEAA